MLTFDQLDATPTTEALRAVGISHARDEHSADDGRHVLTRDADGEVLGRFNCFEANALVRKIITCAIAKDAAV